MNQRGRIAILMTPPVLWLVVLFLLPMGIMAVFSFRAGTFPPQRDIFTLDQYRQYFANTPLHRLLFESAIIALITSILSIVFAYPIASSLAFRGGEPHLTFPPLLTVFTPPPSCPLLLRRIRSPPLPDKTGTGTDPHPARW